MWLFYRWVVVFEGFVIGGGWYWLGLRWCVGMRMSFGCVLCCLGWCGCYRLL